MNNSGDVAEQMVRMSLEGVEAAVKISGTASKEIMLLLIAALKSGEKNNLKLKGEARLKSMLKSGKPLEIFSIKDSDLAKFSQAAKQYGIVYSVLRDATSSPDGICDVMVKADDAPRISRLIERFKFATVSKARIESELIAEKAARTGDTAQETTGKDADMGSMEKLLDELMGGAGGKAAPANAGKEQAEKPPFFKSARQKTSLSGLTFVSKGKPEKTTLNKPSVKEEMREITAARKKDEAEKRGEKQTGEKSKNRQVPTMHKQPGQNKPKSKKLKGSR